MACSGNSQQICGGPAANSVYRTGLTATPTNPPATAFCPYASITYADLSGGVRKQYK